MRRAPSELGKYGQAVPTDPKPSEPGKPPRLLTTAQAARWLGVSASTLARYADKGIVTPTLILPSGHRRWDLDELRRQLAERRERDD